MGTVHKNIFYMLNLNSIGTNFGDNLTDKEFNSSRIVLANSNRSRIIDISLLIYTRPEYYARNIAVNPVKTIPYKIKDPGSNIFKIDIPKLTYQYITSLRLREHLLKIINNSEIVWDGVKYQKRK